MLCFFCAYTLSIVCKSKAYQCFPLGTSHFSLTGYKLYLKTLGEHNYRGLNFYLNQVNTNKKMKQFGAVKPEQKTRRRSDCNV